MELIDQFYTAFQQKDYRGMQKLYHVDAVFRDPVFQRLTSEEVKAMWEMLLTQARDLDVSYQSVTANDHRGNCHWKAKYKFSKTGRPVHNIIEASFQFKDGLIYRHHDAFDLWRWSRQALGLSGLLLGWSPLVQNKIRRTARTSLDKFMAKNKS
ncbi:MAG TPA: nuclear transport factor 2 family protein [Ohtaekwangia sp.]|nr:nuclear transport factor 2 family protein [Ohtaekwangia sp.]